MINFIFYKNFWYSILIEQFLNLYLTATCVKLQITLRNLNCAPPKQPNSRYTKNKPPQNCQTLANETKKTRLH